ncbi:MAG TPA: hypothetical protein VGG28_34180 [Kofleriaceae bacterium]
MALLIWASRVALMVAALDRGDLDEVARQGALAGPATVEKALGSHDRAEQLAAIVAAPAVEDRAELLPALARVAAANDRRVAIPAAHAALTIARDFAKRDRPDDLAADDVESWRASFEAIAKTPSALIETRVIALDVAHALARDRLGFELAPMLADPDPDVMLAAAQIACADHKAEIQVIADRVHGLAKTHAAARDVESCIK